MLEAIEVLYQEDDYIVVDKPAGTYTVPAPRARDFIEGQDLVSRLRAQLQTQLLPVHRLDFPAAGLLILARTPEAHTALQDQFAAHSVHKEYLLRFAMPPQKDQGKIQGYIGPGRKGKMRYAPSLSDIPSAKQAAFKEASMRYRVLDDTWMLCQPREGRRHQVRLLAAAALAPMLGDHKYYPLGGLPGNFDTASPNGNLLCGRLKLSLHGKPLDFVHSLYREKTLGTA